MADESSSTTAMTAITAEASLIDQPINNNDVPAAEEAAASLSSSTTPANATAAPAPSSTNTNTLANASPNNTNIEFEPPAACIRRLLKQCLPKSTNVSKDSLSAISRASGIFILYLTACANDVAREGRRTTIIAKDVLGALKELDFEEFIPCMDVFLEGYRREEKNKKEEKEAMKVKRFQQQQQQQQQQGRDGTTGKFIAKEEDGDNVDGDNDADVDVGDENMQEEVGTYEKMKHARDDEVEDDDDNATATGREGGEPLAKKLKEMENE